MSRISCVPIALAVLVSTTAHGDTEIFPISGIAIDVDCDAHPATTSIALGSAGGHIDGRAFLVFDLDDIPDGFTTASLYAWFVDSSQAVDIALFGSTDGNVPAGGWEFGLDELYFYCGAIEPLGGQSETIDITDPISDAISQLSGHLVVRLSYPHCSGSANAVYGPEETPVERRPRLIFDTAVESQDASLGAVKSRYR